MKFTIDEDVVRKTSTPDGVSLTLPEIVVLLLTKLTDNPHEMIENLYNRGILIKANTLLCQPLRPFVKYNNLLQKILLLSDNSIPSENELTPLAKSLKEIYPKGRKSSSVYWQDGLSATIDRLKSLYRHFPEIKEYSVEQILEATKNYISLFPEDKTYMRTLSYFLWKRDETLSSDLIKMLENPDSTAQNFYDAAELM